MDNDTQQHELQLLIKNILTVGEIDELVAKKLKVSLSMIKQAKAGKKWENNPIKIQEVINAYRKIYNKQNNEIQK